MKKSNDFYGLHFANPFATPIGKAGEQPIETAVPTQIEIDKVYTPEELRAVLGANPDNVRFRSEGNFPFRWMGDSSVDASFTGKGQVVGFKLRERNYKDDNGKPTKDRVVTALVKVLAAELGEETNPKGFWKFLGSPTTPVQINLNRALYQKLTNGADVDFIGEWNVSLGRTYGTITE